MTSSNQSTEYIPSLTCGSLTVREPIKIAKDTSEWKTFTPVILGSAGAVLGTGGANLSYRFRVVGQTLTIQFFHTQTVAGTAGAAGVYLIQLPPGCIAATPSGVVGPAQIVGSSSFLAVANLAGCSIGITYQDPAGAATTTWGPGNLALSTAALTVSFSATVPLALNSPILHA